MYNEIMANEINEIAKDKKDFTYFGLYLAKERSVSALKLLNWLTIAIQEGWINKEIEFNRKTTVQVKDYLGNVNTHQENIPSRLIENPMYVAKEVLDYISKTNKIDFNFQPYKYYSLKEMMTKSLVDFQNPESEMYQLNNVVKKTLEILEYFSTNGTMTINNTMTCFLKDVITKEEIELELRQLAYNIIAAPKSPHIKYEERIKQNLEAEQRLLLQEKQNRFFNEVDFRYYKNVLQPKLIRHEIKLK